MADLSKLRIPGEDTARTIKAIHAALEGTPTAPTASTGTDTTQIATTAFTQQELKANKGKGLLITTEGSAANATVTTDSTKGVSPYNTGYGYTNITVDTAKAGITESNLADGTTLTIQLAVSVASANRNVRIQFGSSGTWIPLFYANAILAGSSYLSAHNARHFIYSTGIYSAGAFHMMADSNSTYSNPASFGIGYGTCTTAAATAAKVVTLSSYNLQTNGIVAVKFTYSVPASATMNINSKGAKAIYYKGAAITANIIQDGDIATFIYNGTQYELLAINTKIDGGGGGSGTVTSVSAGTGLSISGTATINPTVNIASGYKLPTTSEWSGKQDTIVFNTTYSATTNKAATMQDITDIVGVINSALDEINGEVI